MKNKLFGRITVFFAVATLAISMMACGKKAMSEEEYAAKANEMGTVLTQTGTDLMANAAGTEGGDVDGIIASMEELKKPYTDFKAIVAPETMTEADAKLKSGCDGMIAFIDYMIELMNVAKDGGKPDETEMMTKMTELATAAQTDFLEGIALLPAAE